MVRASRRPPRPVCACGECDPNDPLGDTLCGVIPSSEPIAMPPKHKFPPVPKARRAASDRSDRTRTLSDLARTEDSDRNDDGIDP
eukprot:29089-Pelagococcus_subviridis.AAC.4